VDLVAPLRRIDRPVRLVGVLLDEERRCELVQGEAADRLARVRLVVLAVMGPQPGHDLHGAQPGAGGVSPCGAGGEAEQRQEDQGRPFVAPFGIEVQPRENATCLLDLPGDVIVRHG
jgi:hypothetical protein